MLYLLSLAVMQIVDLRDSSEFYPLLRKQDISDVHIRTNTQ